MRHARWLMCLVAVTACSSDPSTESPNDEPDAGVERDEGSMDLEMGPSDGGSSTTDDASAPDLGGIVDMTEPPSDTAVDRGGACGDGTCARAETCSTCEIDCGVCAGTWDCLDEAVTVEAVTGHHEEKFRPDDTAARKAWDAREADFLNAGIRWGMIHIEGDPDHTGMCWAGGYVTSDKPWDASWDDHKDTDGDTRNSTAITNASVSMTVTGLHYFNVHDGDRTTKSTNWLVQHNWGEYVRDDCIENDHFASGRVYDTLFDGCYTGISTRPSSDDMTSDGTGEVVEIDRLLLRLQAMPYPYKWDEKSDTLDVNDEPWDGTGVPYGHGNFFKMESDDVDRNPHFVIRDSVFVGAHPVSEGKFDFPPSQLVDACDNVTIVWLGPGEFPGDLPTDEFPDCFTILTGDDGREFWRQRVADWHARHPNVGAERKPAAPGEIVFPLVF